MQYRLAVAWTHRLLVVVKANPKADWSLEDVHGAARACGLTLRQRGMSHAVLAGALGDENL